MVWFAIAYPTFRRFLIWVAVGIVGVIFLIFMNSSLEKSAQQRAIAERGQQEEAQREAKAAKLGCYHVGKPMTDLPDRYDPAQAGYDPRRLPGTRWPSKFPPCPGDDTTNYIDIPSYANADQEGQVRERWEQLKADEQNKAKAERQRQDAEQRKRWAEHWQQQHEVDRQQACHKLKYDEFRYGAIAPIKWPFTFPPCDESSPGGYTDVPTRACVSGCIVKSTPATRTQADIVAATEGCALACAKPPYALNPSITTNQ